MAPELRKGYAYQGEVDYWSLGVTLFELLASERPFHSKNGYEDRLTGKFKFPTQIKFSEACKRVINGLLCVDAKKRLGFHDGCVTLINHEWFKQFNWNTVCDLKRYGPCKPVGTAKKNTGSHDRHPLLEYLDLKGPQPVNMTMKLSKAFLVHLL